MKKYDTANNYDDIINLPNPTSKVHPRMSLYDRAAQFSPFAALTGHSDAIKETERLTDRRVELDEYERVALDERLQLLMDYLHDEPEISVTYFVPDKLKSGGSYLTETGVVKKMNTYERILIMQNGLHIPIDEIISLNGTIFNQIEEP